MLRSIIWRLGFEVGIFDIPIKAAAANQETDDQMAARLQLEEFVAEEVRRREEQLQPQKETKPQLLQRSSNQLPVNDGPGSIHSSAFRRI